MPTSKWEWFAAVEGSNEYDLASGLTREECIQRARRELDVGKCFTIVEARMSTAKKYEGADIVPFIATRNQETLTAGVSDADV